MKKTSKTQTSQQIMQSLKVNSSLQNWGYNNRYERPKSSLHGLSHCNSCGSDITNMDKSQFQQSTAHQSLSLYQKAPLTPVHKQHIIMIPDVSKSVSQHKEGSKLSLQLNEISMGFNKENKRIQEALFEIRQSTVKKENQRYLKSISLSKKSQTSKKSHNPKVVHSIVKILNFQNLASKNLSKKDKLQQFRKENNKDLINKPQTKLKKKNLYELMKQQKNMLRTLGSNLKNN